MVNNEEKRYIPGTDPAWGRELPEGCDNSLTDKDGNTWDNGYNFDERSDEPEGKTTFDSLIKEVEFSPEAAEKAQAESLNNASGAIDEKDAENHEHKPDV